jgi:hypothetical protein
VRGVCVIAGGWVGGAARVCRAVVSVVCVRQNAEVWSVFECHIHRTRETAARYDGGWTHHTPHRGLQRSKRIIYLSVEYPAHCSARSQEPDDAVVAVARNLHRTLQLPMLPVCEAKAKSNELPLRRTSKI